MPIYEYLCAQCKYTIALKLEVEDRDKLVSCSCGKDMRRIWSPPGITFKGTGFYSTDKGQK